MSLISRISTALSLVGQDLLDDVGQIGKDLVDPRADIGTVVDDFVNTGLTFGGEAIGVAEVAGLRYSVSAYEFKVNDNLTRGSRIEDPQGYQKLKTQGFKSIVDLTLERTGDAGPAEAAGLKTLNVPILDNDAPTEAQMVQFLDFATRRENTPCYVHCEAGKGRTGVAVATYRMAVLGWSVDQALEEARKFGCSQPDQLAFIQSFGEKLKAGQIAGYPVADSLFGS